MNEGKKTEWTQECKEAFQLLQTPLLSTLREGDAMCLYLPVSKYAMSSMLVREEVGIQYTIYYTSKALLDAETKYSIMEKWALALVIAAQN